MQSAILALGCFWGPEEKLCKIKGITSTEVGYCGGNNPNVTYEKVCEGITGHAEVVKLEFDEKIILTLGTTSNAALGNARLGTSTELTITIEISIAVGCENLKLEEVKDITGLDWREKF